MISDGMQQITRPVGLHLPFRIKDLSHIYILWFFRQVAHVDSSSRQEAVTSPLKKWSKMGIRCEYFRNSIIYDHLMIWIYDRFLPIFVARQHVFNLCEVVFVWQPRRFPHFVEAVHCQGRIRRNLQDLGEWNCRQPLTSQLHVQYILIWWNVLFCTILWIPHVTWKLCQVSMWSLEQQFHLRQVSNLGWARWFLKGILVWFCNDP